MLVWQDFVSGGGPYSPLIIQALPWVGIQLKDDKYKTFGRSSENGRKAFISDAKATIKHLFNCVSLCCWVPFNEGWGQFDAAEIAGMVRDLDPTRYIDHASGYHDQGAGDFQSSHVYYKKYRTKTDIYDRVMALTEFGGYSLASPGHMTGEKEFGYKIYKSQAALEAAILDLYRREVLPAIRRGLSADVYTQVSDVEDEINGMFSYDRSVEKLSVRTGETIRDEIGREFGE